jgi:hypothetical protein
MILRPRQTAARDFRSHSSGEAKPILLEEQLYAAIRRARIASAVQSCADSFASQPGACNQ